MSHKKAKIDQKTQTQIHIRCEYINIDPDLKTSLKLNQSKFGATCGI